MRIQKHGCNVEVMCRVQGISATASHLGVLPRTRGRASLGVSRVQYFIHAEILRREEIRQLRIDCHYMWYIFGFASQF